MIYSVSLGRAFFAHSPSKNIKQIQNRALETEKRNVIWELLKSNRENVTLYAIYWVHFVVQEQWTLHNESTKERLFTSPTHHPNHHVWKFGTAIPKDPNQIPTWKVIDFDDQVRKRIHTLTPKHLLFENYEVDPVLAWQHMIT
eukprot:TRINITY_DN3823_c0_g1_i1.p1 TRINITY_DN3823_c0_g1~~TRINITY_DN3823_c0_g1_i1.p1  ORF type:complete len:143 (-),score=22.76 TRINITY_DN3823_c0_g1_i1:39-467(-)